MENEGREILDFAPMDSFSNILNQRGADIGRIQNPDSSSAPGYRIIVIR